MSRHRNPRSLGVDPGWTNFTATGNIIYVSSSTGVDAVGKGTLANPVATIAYAFSNTTIGTLGVGLRDNSSDWVLLKKGDTWTSDPIGQITVSGASATVPILISAYGTGARPLIQVVPADTANGGALYVSNNSTKGNNIAYVGFELYCYTRDPNNASFSSTDAMAGCDGISYLNTGAGGGILFEDLKISYFTVNFDLHPEDSGTPGTLTGVKMNRCVIVDAYPALDSVSHNPIFSQGIHIGGVFSFTIKECLFDHNGWNEVLDAATTVSVTTGTPGSLTWPNNLCPPNNATIYTASSGGGLTAGTTYFIVGKSGLTFHLALTWGGAAIAITSGAPAVWQWAEPSASIKSRNLYLNTSDAVTFLGNISTNSSSEGCQFRFGTTATNNLWVANSEGFQLGHNESFPAITYSQATNNVVLHSGDIKIVPTIQGRGIGINVINATGSGVVVGNNIVAHCSSTSVNKTGITTDGSVGEAVTGISITSNIVFDWPNPITDNGSGNTVSGNVQDATGANTGGAPEPFSDPTRTVESYNVTLGGSSSLTAFLTQARLQSRDNYRTAYTANSVNNYIRAGFGL